MGVADQAILQHRLTLAQAAHKWPRTWRSIIRGFRDARADGVLSRISVRLDWVWQAAYASRATPEAGGLLEAGCLDAPYRFGDRDVETTMKMQYAAMTPETGWDDRGIGMGQSKIGM